MRPFIMLMASIIGLAFCVHTETRGSSSLQKRDLMTARILIARDIDYLVSKILRRAPPSPLKTAQAQGLPPGSPSRSPSRSPPPVDPKSKGDSKSPSNSPQRAGSQSPKSTGETPPPITAPKRSREGSVRAPGSPPRSKPRLFSTPPKLPRLLPSTNQWGKDFIATVNAEKAASDARGNFRIQQAKEARNWKKLQLIQGKNSIDLGHVTQMERTAKAKSDQANAYLVAAHASSKAGLSERTERNKDKAKAAEASAAALKAGAAWADASSLMFQHQQWRGYFTETYGRDDIRTESIRQNYQAFIQDARNKGQDKTEKEKEALYHRLYRGGKDTESSSSSYDSSSGTPSGSPSGSPPGSPSRSSSSNGKT